MPTEYEQAYWTVTILFAAGWLSRMAYVRVKTWREAYLEQQGGQ